MNKKLQDKAWVARPKEFKERVMEIYRVANQGYEYPASNADKINSIGAMQALEALFGKHNLTSDAKGEEMLIVSRKRIQRLLDTCKECDERRAYYGLLTIFGSKCLPDKNEQILSNVEKTGKDFNVAGLSQNSTENCDNEKSVSICENKTCIVEKLEDHIAQYLEMVNPNNEILVSKKMRLEIAVKMAQAILSNSNNEMVGLNGKSIVGLAITITDALIAECKK